ncbi:MAG: hypothetical protein JWR44_2755 [Hymenobacter sp.]|jgi:hypothetical protein|nr:hypothetical protein [Hymenobacter sp.]
MQSSFTHLAACAVLVLGTAGAAQAQSSISFGPRLGLNLSTISQSGTPDGTFSQDTKSIVGVQVGVTANIGITDNFSFQPSVLYSQKGAEFNGSQTDTSNPPYKTSVSATAKVKVNYLELPLNFVYTLGGEEGFQLFAGPYLGVGVGGGGSFSGKLESDDPAIIAFGLVNTYPGSLTLEFADKQNDNANAGNNPGSLNFTYTVRRFDAGLNAGVGYRMGPFQAQLGYGLGLVNIVPNDTDGNDTGSKGHNRVFQLSANYFFGGK